MHLHHRGAVLSEVEGLWGWSEKRARHVLVRQEKGNYKEAVEMVAGCRLDLLIFVLLSLRALDGDMRGCQLVLPLPVAQRPSQCSCKASGGAGLMHGVRDLAKLG